MDISHIVELLNNLFARESFTAHLLERSFRQPIAWVELAVVILLGWLAHWYSQYAIKNNQLKGVHTPALRHIAERLLFPFLMIVMGAITLLLWGFFELPALWLRLLVFAANWLMMIRLVLALINLMLPKKHANGSWERNLSVILWVCFLLWVSGIDEWVLQWMKSMKLPIGSSSLSLYTLLSGIVWIVLIMGVMMTVARWFNARLMQHERLDINVRIVFSKIITSVSMILSIMIALPIVGIDLTVLSVFGGALGVGLGFGLQKIASNYVSGFIILADRSIRPGDRLTVNNFTGYVTEITSRFVVLRSATGQEALIPNETFVTTTVINESYTGKALHQSLNVQVAYHTDLTLALRILQEAAAAQSRIEGEPNAYLIGFGESGIDLRVSFWVKDPENGFLGLYSAILMTIWQRFNEENIEFPFPQREIRILPEEQNPSDMALLKAKIHAKHQDTKSDEPLEEHH